MSGKRRVVVLTLGGGRGLAVRLEDGENFLFGEVEAEGFHRDFEFVVVDPLVLV